MVKERVKQIKDHFQLLASAQAEFWTIVKDHQPVLPPETLEIYQNGMQTYSNYAVEEEGSLAAWTEEEVEMMQGRIKEHLMDLKDHGRAMGKKIAMIKRYMRYGETGIPKHYTQTTI